MQLFVHIAGHDRTVTIIGTGFYARDDYAPPIRCRDYYSQDF